jgi:UDP-N-acetylglucosamine:LPS N-acetylglucosamine transferase
MKRSRPRSTLVMVCSSGGHLTQLYNLKPWWSRFDRVWVTFNTPDAISRLEDEQIVWGYHPTTRNIPNLFRNLWLAWRTLREHRPRLIVSNGAAIAFPFFLIAKLRGIPTVYIEVFDRIDSATLTGRLCYRISDLFLVQWEEQMSLYPRARLVGPLL